ncbi:MAG: prepilin-type N-terminal cleavage/methylation domain-containing protein [Candidatus Paceibacteria bacterium]|jgi:prepilin-type N-terminal cleavage/methylation domain-containing protein
MKLRSTSQLGFSLVEMIVSLGLFSVVITISVGALLMLVATNEQLQSEQTVMTNLSFAIDSMTREIRTGTNYYCVARANPGGLFSTAADQSTLDGTNDCDEGNSGSRSLQGISFIEGGNSVTGGADRILYFYDQTGFENDGKIMRRVGNDAPQSIVSSGIYITNAEFFVSGSESLDSDPTEVDQAAVTIFIEARESSDSTGKPYRIQTTVVQRTLDI